MRLLPPGTAPAASTILWVRGLRSFCDGFVAILLPAYLIRLGFDPLQVGAVTTATLLGSAMLTLGVGLVAHRFERRHLLAAAALLMIATGAGFALAQDFWPLLVIAFVGTINPSSGDVSVFLPLEQELLAGTVQDRDRTALFARYSLIGSLAVAFGSLFAAAPDALTAWTGLPPLTAIQVMFAIYAAVGVIVLLAFSRIPMAPTAVRRGTTPLSPKSRRIVFKLTALFSLDAFAGGFVVQSLLALWLFSRFEVSLATTAHIFFWAGILTSLSFLAAVPLSRRFGLIRTMVFSHLPSNIFLILTAFAPHLGLAIALLMVRAALSQMDVPTRTSYVMAVVEPEERPAVAGITSAPRSLAAAVSPLLAGALLQATAFGWPLVLGGGLKIIYDLLLLANFRNVRPSEERTE